jgi:hypothetical protein
MAKSELARERFRGFVEVSGLDRPYISKVQERYLLEHGMAHFELDLDEARACSSTSPINSIFNSSGYRPAHPANPRARWRVRKKISRREFAAAAKLYNTLAGGVLSEEETRLLVKQLMEGNQFRAKRGGLTFTRHWYRAVSEPRKQGLLPALLNRQL